MNITMQGGSSLDVADAVFGQDFNETLGECVESEGVVYVRVQRRSVELRENIDLLEI